MIYKFTKKLVVLMIGSTVVLIGFIMIVTPGPAFVVIPAGLAILATEFVFAQRLLAPLKKEINDGFPTFHHWKDKLFHWWNNKNIN